MNNTISQLRECPNCMKHFEGTTKILANKLVKPDIRIQVLSENIDISLIESMANATERIYQLK